MTSRRTKPAYPEGLHHLCHEYPRKPFTLIEMVFATSATALLFAALIAVFSATLQGRERAHDRAALAWVRARCLDRMRADLFHAAVPDSLISRGLTGSSSEENGYRRDSLTLDTAVNRLHAQAFGADVVRVAYAVEPVESDTAEPSTALVRRVWRNPLALSEEDPEETVLLAKTHSLTIDYFDGSNWVASWDTALQEGHLPQAIRVVIEQSGETDRTDTIEMTVPILSRQPQTLDQENRGEAPTR